MCAELEQAVNYGTVAVIIHLSRSQTKTFALSFEGKGCVAFDEHLSMAARPLALIPRENQPVHQ